MPHPSAASRLAGLLQLAYSGERAAGYAYRGHWNSVRSPAERDRIKAIEAEEWHHRTLVGEMLEKLGARPRRLLEIKAGVIGRVLGFLCHVSGSLAPVYGAGKLESKNIREYETAARYAREAGHTEFIECLLTMAEVEWDHEVFFRSLVIAHPWGRRIRIWPSPPPREHIRASFLHDANSSEAGRKPASEGNASLLGAAQKK